MCICTIILKFVLILFDKLKMDKTHQLWVYFEGRKDPFCSYEICMVWVYYAGKVRKKGSFETLG